MSIFKKEKTEKLSELIERIKSGNVKILEFGHNKVKPELNTRLGDVIVTNEDGTQFLRRFRDYGTVFDYEIPKYVEREEKVWVPKYENKQEEINNTPLYLEILDGEKVIYSTKDKPAFFKLKYNEIDHKLWYHEYELIRQKIYTKAEKYLTKLFPEWKDTTKYF